MKKIIISLLLLSCSVLAKNYTIGYAGADFEKPWYDAQYQEIRNTVANHDNLKLIAKDSQGSISQQIMNIEALIQEKVDFIIAPPIHPRISSIVLQKALKNNIPVILISRHISTDDYTTFIAPNNYQIGYDAAKLLAQKIKYQGKVLMYQGVANATTSTERENGFMDYLKQYPKISVTKVRANYKKSDAIKVTEEIFIKQKQKFDAIYSHSDAMLVGVREVMNKYNLPIDIPMIGIDYNVEAKEAILLGTQYASFIYQTAGKEAVEIILKMINKQTFNRDIELPTTIITKENAKNIAPIF